MMRRFLPVAAVSLACLLALPASAQRADTPSIGIPGGLATGPVLPAAAPEVSGPVPSTSPDGTQPHPVQAPNPDRTQTHPVQAPNPDGTQTHPDPTPETVSGLRESPPGESAADPVPVPDLLSPAPLGPDLTVADPYSPRHAWEQGDMVTRLTFVLLLAMSVTTWSILLLRAWDQYALVRGLRTLAPLDAPAILGQAQDPAPGGHPRLQAATGRLVAEYARYRSADRPDISLRDWLTMAGTRETSALVERLQSGLGLLASIASTAPFVGLFGTVWGVYHALVAIGLSGEASLDSVAGPVGEALIMTALGLAVAVPAVLAYNDLARRNRRIVSALERLMSCAYMELLRTTPPKHGGAVHAPTR